MAGATGMSRLPANLGYMNIHQPVGVDYV